jgi:hypothetical protein
MHVLPARSAVVEGEIATDKAKIFGFFVQTTISGL